MWRAPKSRHDFPKPGADTAPKNWIPNSAKLSQHTSQVLGTLFKDGSFKIETITIEAWEFQAVHKFNFMRRHGYELVDRVGDDVYVLGWTAAESYCDDIRGSAWLRRKLAQQVADGEGDVSLASLDLQLAPARLQSRRINQTERRALWGYILWSERSQCRAGSLSFLLVKTLLRADVAPRPKSGDLCFLQGLAWAGAAL